jgi:transcriptional regulator with XRE-family HTH domain
VRACNVRLPIVIRVAYRAGIGTVVRNSNQIDKSLGSRLRDKRTSTGWSQEQLAEKLQIDPKDISAYENGAKRISADRLLRLSKVLGVRPVYFFGFEDDERPLRRDGHYFTLPDQGLRLHRAFVGVKNPALREAIVSLVIELAKNDNPA